MKPTQSELTILGILWKEGPSTVRVVNQKLNIERRVGYTNTLKMMQLMHEKKLLSRDESSRSHIYTPLLKAEEVRNDVLSQLIDSVFEGKTTNLLVHALGNYSPSKDELDEIKFLIDNLDSNGTI